MQAFYYQRASDSVTALRAAQAQAGQANIAPTSAAAQFIAGGTQMLDLMKLGAMTAGTLVDLNDLQTSNGQIDASSAGLRLGALVRMTQAAEHPDLDTNRRKIREEILEGAQQQPVWQRFHGSAAQALSCTIACHSSGCHWPAVDGCFGFCSCCVTFAPAPYSLTASGIEG